MEDLRQVVAQRVRGSAQHRSGLCKIALQEVRFSQHDPNGEFVFFGERGRCPEERREQLNRDGGLAALERGAGSCNHWLQRGVGHGVSV
jgi:hypothetical protein